MAEAARGGITDADLDVFEEWAGATNGWTVEAEEKAARGYERYLRDGGMTFSNPVVQKVFEAIKQWMLAIYVQIEGSALDIHITPEVRAIFDKLVGAEMRAAVEAAPPAARAAEHFHASQRGIAYTDMTEAELRELLDEGIGEEPRSPRLRSATAGAARVTAGRLTAHPRLWMWPSPTRVNVCGPRVWRATTPCACRCSVRAPDAEYRVRGHPQWRAHGARWPLCQGRQCHQRRERGAVWDAWDAWWAKNKPNPADATIAPAMHDERTFLGPQKVGGRYFDGYWNKEYTVTAIARDEHGYPTSITVRDEEGTRTHHTAWNAKRDRIIAEPGSDAGVFTADVSGRGGAREQVYGPEAVQQGRAVLLFGRAQHARRDGKGRGRITAP